MCKITTNPISSCTLDSTECSHRDSTSFFSFSTPVRTLCSLISSKSLFECTDTSNS